MSKSKQKRNDQEKSPPSRPRLSRESKYQKKFINNLVRAASADELKSLCL